MFKLVCAIVIGMIFSQAGIATEKSSRQIAQAIPGGSVVHEFSCQLPHAKHSKWGVVGTAWGLSCTTHAVAPQHSFEACSFWTQAVSPQSEKNVIPLIERSQDFKYAMYASKDKEIMVHVNKPTFEATVTDGNMISHCAVTNSQTGEE